MENESRLLATLQENIQALCAVLHQSLFFILFKPACSLVWNGTIPLKFALRLAQ